MRKTSSPGRKSTWPRSSTRAWSNSWNSCPRRRPARYSGESCRKRRTSDAGLADWFVVPGTARLGAGERGETLVARDAAGRQGGGGLHAAQERGGGRSRGWRILARRRARGDARHGARGRGDEDARSEGFRPAGRRHLRAQARRRAPDADGPEAPAEEGRDGAADAEAGKGRGAEARAVGPGAGRARTGADAPEVLER